MLDRENEIRYLSDRTGLSVRYVINYGIEWAEAVAAIYKRDGDPRFEEAMKEVERRKVEKLDFEKRKVFK